MAATLEQLKREVAQRQDECFQLKEAHNRAAETFESRNNALTLIAVVSSSLTGGSAIWSALAATVSAPLPLALWATALASVITTIVTSAQKTPLGSAEEARNHHKAAMGYAELGRAARRLAESDYDEEKLRSALADLDAVFNQTSSTAPFLSKKFLSGAEPAVQLERLSQVGLVDAFETRDSGRAAAKLGERFKSKPAKVHILETWTGYGAQLYTWITQALKDGAEVEILLLDPTSEHVEHRAQALSSTGVDAQTIKSNIEGDLDILGRVLKEYDQNGGNKGHKGKLEVRVYDVTPVVNMYRFDDIRIVGMYLWEEDSITGPQFEVKGTESLRRTPFADHFDAHFKKMWDYTGGIQENRDSSMLKVVTKPLGTGKNPTKQLKVEKGNIVTKPLKEEGEVKAAELRSKWRGSLAYISFWRH
jgi:hypothetical protein